MLDFSFAHTNFEIDSIFETNNSNSLFSLEIDFNRFIGLPFNFERNYESEENSQYNSTPIMKESTKEELSLKKLFLINTPKKRGRKKDNENNLKQHGKFDDDNMIRKIQVSYINFVVDFINQISKEIGRNDLLLIPLDYNFKRSVNKKNREFLKSHTIEEIIQCKASPKFKTKDEKANKEICERIKKENINILLNILKQNFFFFFDKVYYKKARRINLKDFGLEDLEINLDNLELYEDLLSKNKKDIHFEKYKKKINSCIKKYFLPRNQKEIFQCNY